MAANIIDILQSCDLFAALNPAGFRRLAAMGRICQFRKGQLIFRENDPCPGVYVIGQGQVRIFKTGSGGKEHVLHIVGPGGSFAEVAAIGGFAVPASAEAIKKTTCMLLPFERFSRGVGRRSRIVFRHDDEPDALGPTTGHVDGRLNAARRRWPACPVSPGAQALRRRDCEAAGAETLCGQPSKSYERGLFHARFGGWSRPNWWKRSTRRACGFCIPRSSSKWRPDCIQSCSVPCSERTPRRSVAL